MKEAIDETNRRREIQMRYNLENGITPKTIEKKIGGLIRIGADGEKPSKKGRGAASASASAPISRADKAEEIELLRAEMKKAAAELRFEEAAYLRDKIRALEITR